MSEAQLAKLNPWQLREYIDGMSMYKRRKYITLWFELTRITV